MPISSWRYENKLKLAEWIYDGVGREAGFPVEVKDILIRLFDEKHRSRGALLEYSGALPGSWRLKGKYWVQSFYMYDKEFILHTDRRIIGPRRFPVKVEYGLDGMVARWRYNGKANSKFFSSGVSTYTRMNPGIFKNGRSICIKKTDRNGGITLFGEPVNLGRVNGSKEVIVLANIDERYYIDIYGQRLQKANSPTERWRRYRELKIESIKESFEENFDPEWKAEEYKRKLISYFKSRGVSYGGLNLIIEGNLEFRSFRGRVMMRGLEGLVRKDYTFYSDEDESKDVLISVAGNYVFVNDKDGDDKEREDDDLLRNAFKIKGALMRRSIDGGLHIVGLRRCRRNVSIGGVRYGFSASVVNGDGKRAILVHKRFKKKPRFSLLVRDNRRLKIEEIYPISEVQFIRPGKSTKKAKAF